MYVFAYEDAVILVSFQLLSVNTFIFENRKKGSAILLSYGLPRLNIELVCLMFAKRNFCDIIFIIPE